MSNGSITEVSNGTVPTFEEMQDRLGHPRRNILQVLLSADNTAVNTSELREHAGIPTGSMTHHMDLLERWELVEEIDRVHIGQGSRAIVWQLTERGEQFCEEGLELAARDLAHPNDVEVLWERIEELEEEVETLRTKHDNDIEDLRTRTKKAIQKLKDNL